MEERRDIMQAWANFLDMLRDGERVSFRQARAMLDGKQIEHRLEQTGLNHEQIQAVLQVLQDKQG